MVTTWHSVDNNTGHSGLATLTSQLLAEQQRQDQENLRRQMQGLSPHQLIPLPSWWMSDGNGDTHEEPPPSEFKRLSNHKFHELLEEFNKSI